MDREKLRSAAMRIHVATLRFDWPHCYQLNSCPPPGSFPVTSAAGKDRTSADARSYVCVSTANTAEKPTPVSRPRPLRRPAAWEISRADTWDSYAASTPIVDRNRPDGWGCCLCPQRTVRVEVFDLCFLNFGPKLALTSQIRPSLIQGVERLPVLPH